MDDFRIGSVPSSDPYGKREPYASMSRKRPKHPHGESGDQSEDETGVLETAAGEEPAPSDGDTIEDYYTPSEPAEPE